MARFSRLLPAAALAALALAAPAAQGATTPEYTVDVNTIHVVDWQYQGAKYPADCQAWSKGAGTQTIGVRTTTPARYMLLTVPGQGPLLSMSKAGKLVGTGQRETEWRDHAIPQTAACTPCGPLSEYGECDENPMDDLLAPLFDCQAKRGSGVGIVELALAGQSLGEDQPAPLVDTLRVTSDAGFEDWTHCPPNHSGGPGGLKQGRPTPVAITGASVKRFLKLRRGQSITLKGEEERGSSAAGTKTACSAPAGGAGYSECAVTHATVTIRRVK